LKRLWVLGMMGVSLSQVAASCAYSPPPMLSHGQGADTLGPKRWAAGAELGVGTNASWWTASNLGHPEVKSEWVGGGRLRYGLAEDLDVGLVVGQGPLSTTVIGPETKWRLVHLAPAHTEGSPGFHAAWISGCGVGSSLYPYEAEEGQPSPRHIYLAPYTGLLGSGGIDLVQMFSGLRVAASETLGNQRDDLTIYPTLAFGVVLVPLPWLKVHAEADLAAGVTMADVDDTGILAYPSVGITIVPE
jgi:hypothetical protein